MCGSVLANDGGLEQPAHANGHWCRDVNLCLLWQSWTRKSEVSIPQCQVQQLWQDWTSQAVETQTSAIVVDRSGIDDLIAIVETIVAVSVANVDI